MSTSAQIVSAVSQHTNLCSYTDGEWGIPLTLCSVAPVLQFTGQTAPEGTVP